MNLISRSFKESMSKDKDKIVTEMYEKIPTYKERYR